MRKDRGVLEATKAIKKKLKKGTYKLYYHPGCHACKKQLSLLGGDVVDDVVDDVVGTDCSVKKCNVDAYPTWVNTKTNQKVIGVMEPKKLVEILEKKKSVLKPLSTNKMRRRYSYGRLGGRMAPRALAATFGGNLKSQPQPYGYTNACALGKNGGFRSGNDLPPMSLTQLQQDLNNAQNSGPFLGIGRFGFGLGGPGMPCNIYDARTTKLHEAPLNRPYGPQDNLNMQGPHLVGDLPPLPLDFNYTLGQFGRNHWLGRRRRRSKKKKSIKIPLSKNGSYLKIKFYKKGKRSRFSRRRSRQRNYFGATPGTPLWNSQVAKIDLGAKYVSPTLRGAKGYSDSPIGLYQKPNGTLNPQFRNVNLPMQYADNQYNNPATMNFGTEISTYSMEGPNNVAYRPPFPMYQAGGNTTYWLSGKPYLPPKKNITTVQKDPQTPGAWLAQSKGILRDSSHPNGAQRFQRLGSRKFGPSVPGILPLDGNSSKGGFMVAEQPLPPRMQIEMDTPTGSYVNYGKPKKLVTNFGGQTITLARDGKLTIS